MHLWLTEMVMCTRDQASSQDNCLLHSLVTNMIVDSTNQFPLLHEAFFNSPLKISRQCVDFISLDRYGYDNEEERWEDKVTSLRLEARSMIYISKHTIQDMR